MIELKEGKAIEILAEDEETQELLVDVEGSLEKAICYFNLTGKVRVGDRLLLNTTAVTLKLGTGGFHFVVANFSRPWQSLKGPGHIIKLRYTPLQLKCLAAEEEGSPYHVAVQNFQSLKGMPVVVCSLHSQLLPVIAGINSQNKNLRVAYLMSDQGALPIAFSKTVKNLRKKGLICGTITFGHAFGGDIEAVNVYSALILAKVALKADVAVIAMGPGNVGTGTKWGSTALAQGEYLNAVKILGGCPIMVPRVSFADPRERHFGLSHHSLTVINEIALVDFFLALPELKDYKKKERLLEQTKAFSQRVQVHYFPEEFLNKLLLEEVENLSTMGRDFTSDREFFLTAAAGGVLAVEMQKRVEKNG
ncbi:DUF3866 family protein [Carboxydothermus ferrireducens]|uniref:DUF3866 domain-containing protein n=1 Tax=Carboxydothermus ferrireducens DSM 11255 TaxID=1119529 RepID=A0ABX2RCD5_9THEO|nr:DUF3866 family protein [Carboxydothermus ferrireducens]NYE58680.1 hypothetical protein [Carboxydothermus ferrireducens DSM 11255]